VVDGDIAYITSLVLALPVNGRNVSGKIKDTQEQRQYQLQRLPVGPKSDARHTRGVAAASEQSARSHPGVWLSGSASRTEDQIGDTTDTDNGEIRDKDFEWHHQAAELEAQQRG
jgi:hypothetical protein